MPRGTIIRAGKVFGMPPGLDPASRIFKIRKRFPTIDSLEAEVASLMRRQERHQFNMARITRANKIELMRSLKLSEKKAGKESKKTAEVLETELVHLEDTAEFLFTYSELASRNGRRMECIAYRIRGMLALKEMAEKHAKLNAQVQGDEYIKPLARIISIIKKAQEPYRTFYSILYQYPTERELKNHISALKSNTIYIQKQIQSVTRSTTEIKGNTGKGKRGFEGAMRDKQLAADYLRHVYRVTAAELAAAECTLLHQSAELSPELIEKVKKQILAAREEKWRGEE